MSRYAVSGIFLLLTGATAWGAVGAWGDVVAEPSGRSLAGAGYAALRTAVVLAFSLFTFTRDPSRRPAREPVAFLACGLAIAAVVVLQPPDSATSTPLILAGEVVALAACVWLLCSVLVLGRCFGVLPEVRGLVTRGPYGVVRHPVYLGELTACAGLVLASPSIWNFAVIVVFVGAQTIRMHL